jgi:hypothetical protein
MHAIAIDILFSFACAEAPSSVVYESKMVGLIEGEVVSFRCGEGMDLRPIVGVGLATAFSVDSEGAPLPGCMHMHLFTLASNSNSFLT